MIEKSITTSVEAKSIVNSSGGPPKPMTLQDIQDFLNLARAEEWPYTAAPEVVTDAMGTHITFMRLQKKRVP